MRKCRKSSQDISLNETIDTDKDGNPLTLFDIMSVDDNIIDELDLKFNRSKLKQFIDEELDEREKKIISMRFYRGKTQMEIADEIGISQAQVSRIEKGALERIRKQI